jgi:hypothetical protein
MTVKKSAMDKKTLASAATAALKALVFCGGLAWMGFAIEALVRPGWEPACVESQLSGSLLLHAALQGVALCNAAAEAAATAAAGKPEEGSTRAAFRKARRGSLAVLTVSGLAWAIRELSRDCVARAGRMEDPVYAATYAWVWVQGGVLALTGARLALARLLVLRTSSPAPPAEGGRARPSRGAGLLSGSLDSGALP